MQIEDPQTGTTARVDQNQRLHVAAKASPVQHIVSEELEDAYQIIGEATPVVGTVIPLFITNNDTTKKCVLSYIRLQVVGQSPTGPATTEYFSIRTGGSYTSGGTSIIPVNMHVGSSKAASVTVYKENSLVVSAGSEIDRWYPDAAGAIERYNKEGALVIPAGGSIEVAYVGTGTTGLAYTRASFYMEDAD